MVLGGFRSFHGLVTTKFLHVCRLPLMSQKL